MDNDINKILSEWKKRLDKKTDDITRATDKATLKAALFCEGEAKKNVMDVVYSTPIPDGGHRTGLLKASIGSGMYESRPHTAMIFASAPYAKYLEFGTSHITPRPFMYPAVHQHREDIRNIIAKYLKEAAKLDGK